MKTNCFAFVSLIAVVFTLAAPPGRVLTLGEAGEIRGGQCFSNAECNPGTATCFTSNAIDNDDIIECPTAGICTSCEFPDRATPGCTGTAEETICRRNGTVDCGCLMGGVCVAGECDNRYGCEASGKQCIDYDDCEDKPQAGCPW